jgi:hypothetical protein
MKFSTVFAVFVFALSAFAQTGDTVFSQEYISANVDGGVQAASLADDFVPVLSGDFQYVVLWMCFTTTPDSVFIKVSKDNGDLNPNTATTLVSGDLVPSIVATGDTLYGVSVSEVTFTFPSATSVNAGERYWLEVGTVTGSYWVYQDPVVFGTSMWNYVAGQYHLLSDAAKNWDSFFELRAPVSLQRSSWGSIKTSF